MLIACLIAAERRCDATAVYVKEENKRVGGAVEAALLANVSLEECQSECLGAERFLCRALEYDEATRQCALLEEDSVSQRDLLRTASSPSHHLYDLVCPRQNPRQSHSACGRRVGRRPAARARMRCAWPILRSAGARAQPTPPLCPQPCA